MVLRSTPDLKINFDPTPIAKRITVYQKEYYLPISQKSYLKLSATPLSFLLT